MTEPAREPRPSTDRSRAQRPLRVLIVDDDELFRATLGRILSRRGYQVVTVPDVAGALALLDAQPFDAAVVDYDLGSGNGVEVLSGVEAVWPDCLRVLMTGGREFAALTSAVNRGGANRVLAKPFGTGELLDTLRDGLGKIERARQRMERRATDSFTVDDGLVTQCLREKLLHIALQPIVRSSDGRVMAFEALLRPRHPRCDTPMGLLRAAERTGRIDEVGQAVFKLAAEALGRIDSEAGLWVNLHPEQLADTERLTRDIAVLRPNSARVAIEITEHAALGRIDGWEDSLAMLNAAGFSIAIDDLGAGHNSLAMLADLRPHFIKIDASLVRRVHEDGRRRRLVQLLTLFGRSTDITIVGEGVESEAEAMTLAESGVHLQQGFYFARPSIDTIPRGVFPIPGITKRARAATAMRGHRRPEPGGPYDWLARMWSTSCG